MDKFIEIFTKQNPYVSPDCPNCEHKLTIKSKEFFNSKTNSKISCPHCKEEIELSYIKKDFESVIKHLNKMCK